MSSLLVVSTSIIVVICLIGIMHFIILKPYSEKTYRKFHVDFSKEFTIQRNRGYVYNEAGERTKIIFLEEEPKTLIRNRYRRASSNKVMIIIGMLFVSWVSFNFFNNQLLNKYTFTTWEFLGISGLFVISIIIIYFIARIIYLAPTYSRLMRINRINRKSGIPKVSFSSVAIKQNKPLYKVLFNFLLNKSYADIGDFFITVLYIPVLVILIILIIVKVS